jgi:signal transduction histidine kinase
MQRLSGDYFSSKRLGADRVPAVPDAESAQTRHHSVLVGNCYRVSGRARKVGHADAYALARVSIRPLAAARAHEERFASDAAHELRTPLATIAAVAQSARQKDPAAQTAALGKIEEVALAASGLAGRSAGAHARGTRRFAITRAG